MESQEIKSIIEGLLFASGDDGVTLKQLVRILEIPVKSVEQALEELKSNYEKENRGMIMMESKGVFHLATKPEHSSYLRKLLEIPRPSKMSQAALETLAIIAYQQPITKVEIDELRGVKSDRPIQTLLSRSLIEEVGRKDAVGKPILYGTNKEFLIYFGLTSLEELPPLPEDSNDDNNEADLFFERFNELEE